MEILVCRHMVLSIPEQIHVGDENGIAKICS